MLAHQHVRSPVARPERELSRGAGALPSVQRVPPHNLDAERAILGAILLDREAVGLARERIVADDFYRREHRLIFDAMCRMYEDDQAIDAITVSELLSREDHLDAAGGTDYLNALAATVATAANVVFHASIVREKSLLRRLIHTSGEIATEAFEGAEDAASVLDRAQAMIYSLTELERPGDFAPVGKLVSEAFRSIEEAYRSGKDLTGLRTGFADLDRMLGGLQNSDLVVLAARPSMGKTSLALNLAYNIAARDNIGVAIFSMEMAREQLVLRMLCSSGGFNLHDVRRGKIRPEDWPRLTQACERLSSAPIFIDDSSGLSVLEMKAKARRLKQQHGIGLVIIDYLQLMAAPGRGIENRQQEISHISRNLKGLAKDLDMPVLALSQLSRAVEARGRDHRPILSDLRESGSIEQDADVVLFIFREEVYKPDDDTVRNLATIIVGKQRNGPTGRFDLHFHKAYTRFTDLVREESYAREGEGEVEF
jgi:replicative DNA helicase